tara:strand:- start:8521 stop:8676 length:156 start_codon:yes stop_codon:yes gene_type:complete
MEKNLKNIKSKEKKHWETPTLQVLDLSETRNGTKNFVEGEPNPFGFGLYGS